MSEQYDPENLYTLTDEDGCETTFELLDAMDLGNKRYFALTPFYPDAQVRLERPEDLLIMQMSEEGGIELMVSLEDEAEYRRVFELFIDRFQQMWELENQP